jgi:hypothetical protein
VVVVQLWVLLVSVRAGGVLMARQRLLVVWLLLCIRGSQDCMSSCLAPGFDVQAQSYRGLLASYVYFTGEIRVIWLKSTGHRSATTLAGSWATWTLALSSLH